MTPSNRRIVRPVAVAAVLGLAVLAWLVLRPGAERMREIVTVDAAGDTLVYSGPVRDAIARARIIEAFNSVSVPNPTGTPEADPDTLDRDAAARAARQAAVDELARMYTGPADVDAVLGALNLAIIEFEPGSTVLPPDAAGFIQAAAEVIGRTSNGMVLVVVGRAPDEEGDGATAEPRPPDAGEPSLARRRAQVLVDALVRAGADAERLRAEGEDESRGGGASGKERERGHIVFRLGAPSPSDDEAASDDDAASDEEAADDDEAADEIAGDDADR